MSTSKTLTIGAAALVVIGLGGIAAAHFVRQQVIADVESQFATLGTAFAKAEHGPIDFDWWNRTLEIKQISLLPKNTEPGAATTIASVKAFGAAGRDGGFAADRLEIRGLTAHTTAPKIVSLAPEAEVRIAYEIPTIEVDQFAMRRLGPETASDPIAAAIPLIEALSAKSISVATLKTTSTLPSTAKPNSANPFAGNIEQTQHDVRIENLRDGRIAKATIGRLTMTGKMQPPASGDMAAEARDGYATDYDLIGLLAVLAPEGVVKRPAGPTLLWQTVGVGPTSIKLGNQINVVLSGVTIDKVAVDTAKLRPAWATFKANQPTTARQSPAQQQAFANATADVYESISFGRFEYRGIDLAGTGFEPVKIASFVMDDYQSGTLRTLALTGLDGKTLKQEAFHLGRFALRDLKLPQMLRLTGRLTPAMAATTRPGQIYSDVLRTLGGIELSDLKVPDPRSGQQINLETANMSWGAFVGQFPTTGQFNFKMDMPLPTAAPGTPDPFAALARAGLRTAKLRYNGKWSWQEAPQTLGQTIDFEFADVATGTARLELGNVTRRALLAGPDQLALTSPDMQLGPIVVTLRDQGMVKLASEDPDLNVQRLQTIQSLKSANPMLPPDSIEVTAIKAGLAKFIEEPGQSLTIELVPKAPTNLAQVMAAAKSGPELMVFLTTAFDARVTSGPAK